MHLLPCPSRLALQPALQLQWKRPACTSTIRMGKCFQSAPQFRNVARRAAGKLFISRRAVMASAFALGHSMAL